MISLRTTDRDPHGRFDPRRGPAVQNIRSGFVRPGSPRGPRETPASGPELGSEQQCGRKAGSGSGPDTATPYAAFRDDAGQYAEGGGPRRGGRRRAETVG
jgi:hypothetical protein